MKKWAYLFSTIIFAVFSAQFAGCATKNAIQPMPESDISAPAPEKKEAPSPKPEKTKNAQKRVSDVDALIQEIYTDGAHIIIECPIDLGEQQIAVADGVFIEGEESAVLFNGELLGANAQNVRLENLTFWGCPVTFLGDCKSVKVSFCTFSADENGILSVLTISKGLGVEVSHCEFLGDENAELPLAIFGARENIAQECQIQIHHSRFSGNAGIQSKAAMIHLYDCEFLYLEDGNPRFFLGPGTATQIIVEMCRFNNGEKPIVCYFDISATVYAGTFSRFYQNKCKPEIREEMCIFDNSDALKSFKIHLASKKMWEIPYDYDLVDLFIYETKIGH